MPFRWGKVIVGKVEKYIGLLGQEYLCSLLKFTKIVGEKSVYMIIVFMDPSPLARVFSTIGTNVALEVRPMEHVKPSAMQVVVDFCSQNSLEYNISEPDAGYEAKLSFSPAGSVSIVTWLPSLYIPSRIIIASGSWICF